MKKYIILTAIMLVSKVSSQNREILFLDYETKKPISNVQIYSDNNLLTISDSKGNSNIDLTNLSKIYFMKEDYYDEYVSINELNKTIFLKKITAIKLDEVIISNINIDKILDSVNKKITYDKTSFKNPKYFQAFNSLLINNDTLIYLNKRFNFKPKNGYYCDKDNKIICNFNNPDKIYPIYKIQNSEFALFYNFIHNTSPQNSLEFQVVTKNKSSFQYKMQKSDGMYLITFEPKKKNSEFPYSGFLIIDMDDFGIYEFKVNTNTNKNIRNVVFKDEILNFKIINEESFVKYIKNEDNEYELIKYSYDIEFNSINGKFKDAKFINKYRKETTNPFNNDKLFKLNTATYKFD